VFFGSYQAPPIRSNQHVAVLIRDWTLSALGAIRSGLPFTVYATGDFTAQVPEYCVNQRADLIAPEQVQTSRPTAGGRILLNAAAFANPGPNVLGTSGRNAIAGPGLFNLDASIARIFRLPGLREAPRLTVRADFYNVLNHANLNNPGSFLGAPDFGLALYGRRELNNGFPLLAPLNETARQVQILLRLEF